MTLPDAELLCAELADLMRARLPRDAALVGIVTGGAWLAQRLHEALGLSVPWGSLDVSFYRDDYRRIGLHRDPRPSHIPFAVEGSHIVIVDDVLYTGRTIRAAMNELFDFGRPARIELAVLADRGGRELPICADYCAHGLSLLPSQNLRLRRDDAGRLSLQLVEK